MGTRWKILVVVGLLVALLDQWTKFLAVKHLTPGLTNATSSIETTANIAPSALENIGHFYSGVEHPCDGPRMTHCPVVAVVDGFWNWRYVENPGAAWGLFSTASDAFRVPFFLFVSLGALTFIILFFRRLGDDQLLLSFALAAVFGGAIGNFIDRLHLSYVIDFIDWYVGTKHWPTFNVADAAISSGVTLLFIEWIREAIRSSKKSKTEDIPAEST